MSIENGPTYERQEVDYDTGVPVTPVVANAPLVNDERYVEVRQVADRVVVDPAVVQAPVVAQTQVVAPAAVRTVFSRRFAPDAIIAAAFGLILLLIGLLAITRGGFDGPMSDPVVQVLGFSHTTTLGLIEIAAGAFLLIAGATTSRSGAIFMSSVLGIGAFVGALQTKSFEKSLALESSFAWLVVLGSIAVLLSALLLPRYITRTRTVRPVQQF